MPPRLPSLPIQQLQLHQFLWSRPTVPSPLSILIQNHHNLLQSQSQSQSRSAHILASLSDNPGAYKKRIRRGRGPASGKGKTSGRGHGGQKQHGKVPAGFNGGQTPDHVVHGERGFKNELSIDLAPINLDRIQSWIDQGRINPSYPITVRELAQSRCIHQAKEGVKLLAHSITSSPSSSETPLLKQPVHIVVSRASATAIAAVEAAGGSVATRYYTPEAIKRILKRETHPFISGAWSKESGSEGLLKASGIANGDGNGSGNENGKINERDVMRENGFRYRLPDPTARRDIEYYRDPEKRGYLAHLLRPSEGPSLFFRSPLERKSTVGVKKEKVLPENRLW